MKLSAVAVDFDGTIAESDVLEPAVRTALAELRAQGVLIVLATGRILDDLRLVAGDLHFADAVVAENGAVVEFPASGHLTVNGPAPPNRLLSALERDGIRFRAGQVLVDAFADDAGRILESIRRLELPLVLAFNRDRVMVLPQTISKATGVRQALTILRLSPHNVVAIGDAENDYELLRACEVGVAVDWGSAALKASADYVLPGHGPAAVAEFLLTLANRQSVPTPLKTRRSLTLGHTPDGRTLDLAVRGRNTLIAGDPKSGKSWVTGLLCEQLILAGYGLCVLDPEGDYLSLEALPGVMVLGGNNPPPRPMDLLRAVRHADVSLVIDLSHAEHRDKVEYVRTVLPSLAALRRHTGLPHRIVVDEAHYFLSGSDGARLLDPELRGYTLVSYRASQLHPDVLATSETVIVTRESDPGEVRALLEHCDGCAPGARRSDWESMFGTLALGEAVVLPVSANDEAQGTARRITLAPRLTPHVRHLAKYIDIPVPESRAFVFGHDAGPLRAPARTLRDLVEALEQLPLAVVRGHLERHDFSRWITGVFGDHLLGRTVRQLESGFQARANREVARDLAHAVRARYELIDPVLSQLPTADDMPPSA